MESWSFQTIYSLFRETVNEFLEDRAPRLGAALAFYTVFSLAPLLIVVITITGLLFDPELVRAQILTQFQGLIGQDGSELVEGMLRSTRADYEGGVMATVLGVVALLFGALGVFGQLQDAFNTIWEVQLKEGGSIMRLVQQRLLSLTMVLGLSFLLIVSLVLSAFMASLSSFIGGLLPGFDLVLTILNLLLSLAVLTVVFAMMFKYLPDANIPWRKVWIGAAITAVLFVLGQFLIGLYLGNTDVGSAFGAAGSLVILLLWIYYSTQILFFGAEFTQVYTNKFGEGAEPAENAEPVTEEARAQQGMPHRDGRPSDGETPPGDQRDQPEIAARPAGAGAAYVAVSEETAAAVAAEKPALPLQRDYGYALAFFIFSAGLGVGALVSRELERLNNHH